MRLLKDNTRKNRLIKKLRAENAELKNPFYPMGRILKVVGELIALKKKTFAPGGVILEGSTHRPEAESIIFNSKQPIKEYRAPVTLEEIKGHYETHFLTTDQFMHLVECFYENKRNL